MNKGLVTGVLKLGAVTFGFFMRHFVFLICVLALSGCVLLDDEDLGRGFVDCGDGNLHVVCQPGTYCSAPRQAYCTEGCVSDANCMEHEKCFKEEAGDRVGVCIPTKKPAPQSCCY